MKKYAFWGFIGVCSVYGATIMPQLSNGEVNGLSRMDRCQIAAKSCNLQSFEQFHRRYGAIGY